MKPVVVIETIHEDAKMPERATPGSAGMDLYAVESVALYPGEARAVATGLKMAIPPGYEGQIRSRSGLSLKNIVVANAPGTIDSDYRGEVKVILQNTKNTTEPLLAEHTPIVKGTRIAQLVIAAVPEISLEAGKVDDDTVRGEGGFGSTGE